MRIVASTTCFSFLLWPVGWASTICCDVEGLLTSDTDAVQTCLLEQVLIHEAVLSILDAHLPIDGGLACVDVPEHCGEGLTTVHLQIAEVTVINILATLQVDSSWRYEPIEAHNQLTHGEERTQHNRSHIAWLHLYSGCCCHQEHENHEDHIQKRGGIGSVILDECDVFTMSTNNQMSMNKALILRIHSAQLSMLPVRILA